MAVGPPRIKLNYPGAPSAQKIYDITVTNNTIEIRARNDADNAGNSLVVFERTGTTPTLVTFPTPITMESSTTARPVGYKGLPVNSSSGSSVTLTADMNGQGITRASGTTDVTINDTLPNEGVFTIASIDPSATININASGVTITNLFDGTTGDFTIDSTTGIATLWKVSAGQYVLTGTNVTAQ